MFAHVCAAKFHLRRHHPVAGVDLVRIGGSFPSFSDDDAFILYNEGFTGVSAVARDGSNKQLIFKVGASRSLCTPLS